MSTRRDFLRMAAAASTVAATAGSAAGATVPPTDSRRASAAEGGPATEPSPKTAAAPPGGDRAYWCEIASRLATPVLTALAQRRLKATMPVEARDSKDRASFTYLEALGRLLCGIAPWLELGADTSPEGAVRGRFAALAREALDAATDPASPDFMNFSRGRQPVVDAAFLAQALLRAPRELWEKLPTRVKNNVVTALQSSRPIKPGENNWKLFAAEIEAFLHRHGIAVDNERLFDALRSFTHWYVGDGMYGDGPEFHWDYYNSFVIQPMLLETLDVVGDSSAEWRQFRAQVRARLTRFAAIEERLVAPDGSYPVIGRSIAYRCGAFQALALAAWRGLLPKGVTPAQVRVALTAVIRRTLEAPGTWDENGWLQIGVAGHQPDIGENYISTGSLYLCSTALLPLGLPATHPFWSAPPARTTWEKVWSGVDVHADHALSER